MVDEDLLRENPLAKEGIKMLAQSGVLRAQQERFREQILSGDPDEADESVAKQIKEFRRKTGYLESLQLIGERYMSEGESK